MNKNLYGEFVKSTRFLDQLYLNKAEKKEDSFALHPEILMPEIPGGHKKIAFLTSSQVMLVCTPHTLERPAEPARLSRVPRTRDGAAGDPLGCNSVANQPEASAEIGAERPVSSPGRNGNISEDR